jgi:hypothetical protein
MPCKKNFSKSFGKPLDKHHKMWYNISVVRERYRPPHQIKILCVRKGKHNYGYYE